MYIDKFFDLIKVYDTDYTKVRIGNKGDGGYIIPDELCINIDHVYSFGIGDDIGFELEFKERYGSQVVCFDHTIDSLPENPGFTHIPIGLGQGIGIRELRREYMKYGIDKLLKIDVEYDEWDFLDYSSEYNIIIIELHILTVSSIMERSPYFTSFYNKFHDIVNEDLFAKYYFFLDALLNNYFIFHAHGNNSLPKTILHGYEFPPLLELTMINNRKFRHKNISNRKFPITRIDYPNKTDRPDFEFLFPFKET